MNQNKIVNLLNRALGSTGTKLKKEDEKNSRNIRNNKHRRFIKY